MKNLWLLIFFCISVVSFASDRVDLTIWYNVGSKSEQALFEDQVRRFNSQHQNINLNTLVLPQSAFSDFVVKEAKQGRLPDLLYFQSGSLSRYVWSDLLMPINQLLSEEFLNNVTQTIRQQGTYPIDGREYALSPTSDALTLFANRQLLADAGVTVPRSIEEAWSLDEFHNALDLLAKKHGKWPLDMQLYYADDDWYVTAFSPFIQSTGGEIISNTKWDAHIALESLFMDDFKKVLSPLVQNNWIVPSHKSTRRFEKRRASLSLATTSQWPSFKSALGDDVVAIPFPVLGPYHVTSNDNWSYGITSQTKNPQQAAEFMKFIMSDEEVLMSSNGNYSVPATLSALSKSPIFGERGPLSIPASQLAASARPKPLHPAYPVIRAALADAMDDILTGTDFNVALSSAADVIDLDIEKNNGYPPFDDM
ncbi:extracellular solute-binding protein [Reinekea marina]|uniref:ABC transporter substrate-binding protein n=1 Tax=Reinekea marina TaxID=1310421 RepID=A0ABV7WN47_9GAMM|nr:extracellular solute-binding protein [Reinekea marina]MDN3649869.1 extracellular solute-binding protein [Reinekea marina]